MQIIIAFQQKCTYEQPQALASQKKTVCFIWNGFYVSPSACRKAIHHLLIIQPGFDVSYLI